MVLSVNDGGSDVVVIGELSAPGSDVVTIDSAKAPELPDGAVLNDDGSVTLSLQFPVDQEWKKAGQESTTKQVYESLTLHRLKGRDLVRIGQAKKGEGGMLGIALSCRMSEILFAKLFDKMDAVDIMAAGKVVEYFLGSGRPTGG